MIFDTAISKSSCVTWMRLSLSANMPAQLSLSVPAASHDWRMKLQRSVSYSTAPHMLTARNPFKSASVA